MPSEYQRWIARNEKPAEKQELTPAEKRKNWLDYHKWHIVAVVAALMLIAGLISNNLDQKLHGPDLQIAYIGNRYLPEETVQALEIALAGFAQDITGDGEAKVHIRQYVLADDMVAYTQIETDLVAGESRFYLMEDPEDFQKRFGALGYGDGVFADEVTREEPLWYDWEECPALAGLELDAQSQALLSKLWIGRRGIEKSYERGDMDNGIWEKLIAGVPEE